MLAALKKAGREDLIGYGKGCLIRPHRGEQPPAAAKKPSAPAKKAAAGRAPSRTGAGRPAAPKKKGWAKAKRKK